MLIGEPGVRVFAREYEAKDFGDWDAFVTGCENATFYQLSRWSEAVNTLPGQNIQRIVAVLYDGQIVAGLTLGVKEKGGLRVAIKPWATPYCGILYNSGLSAGVKSKINKALSTYLSNRYDRIMLEASTSFKDVLAFQAAGWQLSVKSTYTITKTAHTLKERVEPSVRRQVEKAKRQKLSIRKAEHTSEFYELYRRCYERMGIKLPFGPERFRRFYCRLTSEAGTALWYVYDHEEVVAGMLINRFNNYHHYTLAAFARNRSELAAPSFLIHDYIENFMKPGEVFDFVGANAYTAGITHFKRKFNPVETPYFVLERRSWRYQLCQPAIKMIQRIHR